MSQPGAIAITITITSAFVGVPYILGAVTAFGLAGSIATRPRLFLVPVRGAHYRGSDCLDSRVDRVV